MQDRHVDRRWLCGLGLRLLVLLPLLFASAVGCATLPTYDYDTEIDPTKRDYVLGPGDIALAHQPNESVSRADLHRAIDVYESLIASICLSESA